jgi:hypothetical protein
VLVKGREPDVSAYALDRSADEYRITRDFELQGSGSDAVESTCRESESSLVMLSDAVAKLDFSCQRPAREGRFAIRLLPSKIGLEGPPAELSIRVLKEVPPTAPVPPGWVAFPLAAGSPEDCETDPQVHVARLQAAKLRLDREEAHSAEIFHLPYDLSIRMTLEHARGVRYVFDYPDGWIVMFDQGEFGGGIEWYAHGGGDALSIAMIADAAHPMPENVLRAVARGPIVFVLQGLAHGTSSSGQLAALWREGDAFATRVIARYDSKPSDWQPEPDGSWLVLTTTSIWRTSPGGDHALILRLPRAAHGMDSLAQTPDGSFYVTGLDGVVRLSPTWSEPPRHRADMVLAQGSAIERCWTRWARASAPQ